MPDHPGASTGPPAPSTTGTTRTLTYAALALALLLVPTAAGFALAGSVDDPAPGSDGPADAVSSTSLATDAPIGGADAGEDDSPFPRLQYSTGDAFAVPLADGGVVPLGNGVELVIDLDPFPADRLEIDVRYRLQRADGAPIDNAAIDVAWDMRFMLHGPFETRMEAVGDGTYASTFDFIMFGPWYLDTTVDVPGVPPVDVSIDVYVWPSGSMQAP